MDMLTTKSTKQFLFEKFQYLFALLIMMTTLLGSCITYYQLLNIKKIYEARLLTAISQKQNELLDELALGETVSLVLHLNNIRKELNVDRIILDYKNQQFSSEPGNKVSRIENAVSLLFSKTHLVNPLIINIASDFGNVKLTIRIYYNHAITSWILFPTILSALSMLLITFVFSGIIFILLFKRIYSKLIFPLNTLTTSLKTGDLTWLSNFNMPVIKEIADLKTANEFFVEQKLKQADLLSKIASQVAHDIRSPLATLSIVISSIAHLPEKQRILIRRATNQINDIANNLLIQHSKQHINTVTSPELISDLIFSISSEKRAEYKNTSVNLDIHIDNAAYGSFVSLIVSEFKRVLSNLINNAIESCVNKTASAVQINLSVLAENIVISIQDNGCGIPDDLLKKITSGEVYTQKKDGHGLGLPNAIKMITEKWGGQYSIDSCANKGTTFNIILPKASVPKWFCPELALSDKSMIAILDDDESIHQVWDVRFEQVNAILDFIHFYLPENLIVWKKNNTKKNIFYLVDYELIGSSKTGLDVIEETGIAEYACLVTSRYEEKEIRMRCERLGVRIIPKSVAAYIPIRITQEDNISLINKT